MEEKKMNEQQSLELIAQMISSTKENLRVGSGNVFLLYGYVALALSVAIYALVYFTHNPIWSACCFLMFTPMVVRKFKTGSTKSEVTTYIDSAINGTWMVVGGLFIVTILAMIAMSTIFGVVNFALMLPLALIYTGIGTSITGVIIKEPVLIYTPLISFIFAIYMLMAYTLGEGTQLVWYLYFGLSFLVMMVVPGHILNSKSKRNV